MSFPDDPRDGQSDDQIARKEYRAGSRLYLVVGLAAGVLHVFAPEGPFRWLLLAIAIVCLTRSTWYYARSRSFPEPPASPPDRPAP